MTDNRYNEDYFKSANYSDYSERRERYIMTAKNMIHTLEALSFIDNDSRILDYGCAVGFLMEGFKLRGYSNIFGYDISEWAVTQARSKGLTILDKLEPTIDFMVALDVFEHMTDEDISTVIETVQPPSILVRIPCAEEGTDFHLAVSRRDQTHINCKNKEAWKEYFKSHGFDVALKLKLETIYDSRGVFCAILLSSNNKEYI